jgi:hypothetical protein
VISWKAPYGYRRIPRGPDRPARLEIFESEAAIVRRIFADRAAWTTIRQICRQLNADAVPTPTGSHSQIWLRLLPGTLSELRPSKATVRARLGQRPGHHLGQGFSAATQTAPLDPHAFSDGRGRIRRLASPKIGGREVGAEAYWGP